MPRRVGAFAALSDSDSVDGLARCWEATVETEMPQYRDGEKGGVRRILKMAHEKNGAERWLDT